MKRTPIKVLSILVLGASLSGCAMLSSLTQRSSTKFSKYSHEVGSEEFSSEMVNSIQNNPVLNGTGEVKDFALSLTANASVSQKITNSKLSKKDRGSITASAKASAKLAYDEDPDAAEITGKLSVDGKLVAPTTGTQKVSSESSVDFLIQDYGSETVTLVNKNDQTYQVSEVDAESAPTLGDALSSFKSFMGLGAYYLSTALSSIDPEAQEGVNLKLYKDGEVYTIVYSQEMNGQKLTSYDSETSTYEEYATMDMKGEVKLQFDLSEKVKIRASVEVKTTTNYTVDGAQDSSNASIIGLSLPVQHLAGDKAVEEEKLSLGMDYVEKNQTVKKVNLSSYRQVEEILNF